MSYNGFCPWCTAGGFTKEELKHHLLHECEDFRLGDSVSSGEDLDWYELFMDEIAQCNALRANLALVTSERDEARTRIKKVLEIDHSLRAERDESRQDHTDIDALAADNARLREAVGKLVETSKSANRRLETIADDFHCVGYNHRSVGTDCDCDGCSCIRRDAGEDSDLTDAIAAAEAALKGDS